MTGLVWEAPGPGRWDFDANHFPRPLGPAAAEVFAAGTRAGTARGFARHGNPCQVFEAALVNRVFFFRVVPVVDAAELERRAATAVAAWRERVWEAEARRWYEVTKPARSTANLVLQATDPWSLDAGALADHLATAARNCQEGVAEHMELVPVGDVVGRLLVLTQRHGVPDPDALALLAGYSPGSAGAAAAVNHIARVLDRPPTSLDEVRAAGPDAAGALDRYLLEHEWRLLTGYSIEGRTLAESSEAVVRAIADAVVRPRPIARADDTLVDGVLSMVPPSDHAAFHSLLADARAAYGVRDDNEGVALLWPTGLYRRAVLAAGDRLGLGGLAFEASLTELLDLLAGAGPSAADLDDRASVRAAVAASPIPAWLGSDDDAGRPPLPAAMADAAAAMAAAWGAEFGTIGSVQADGSVTGSGIGTASYTGRACVAANADEALDRLQPGDVLITTNTTSAFNAVLTVAGALVVTSGGSNSHAALVARELGLPAVIGAAGAIDVFRSGQLVQVDPAAGVVRPAPPGR